MTHVCCVRACVRAGMRVCVVGVDGLSQRVTD